MANYSVTNSTFQSGTVQVAINANSSQGWTVGIGGANASPRRGKIYDILVGTAGTPADNYVQWSVVEFTGNTTAAGTVSTPVKLDQADAAATSLAVINSTANGTITVNSELWFVGINQRASYRWVAAPGSELVWPATSSAGLVLRAAGTATVFPTGTVMFQEQ